MQIVQNNVNGALGVALGLLHDVGVPHDSRNGRVFRFPEPVLIKYLDPRRRVLFSKVRNANPMFHLAESIWMLGGRNDVAFVAQYVKRMREFSDDGSHLHGAYGCRWRHTKPFTSSQMDQLKRLATHLREKPDTRRAVLQMWNAEWDLPRIDDGKDVPCNTHIYFSRNNGGALDMTVCNRSNDVWWGCFGANAVHMSVLHEYMAVMVGCPVGVYNQFTNDLHLYPDNVPQADDLSRLGHSVLREDYYRMPLACPKEYMGEYMHVPLLSTDEGETIEQFDEDVGRFLDLGLTNPPYRTRFFDSVISPMQLAWSNRRQPDTALVFAERIAALDWRYAMESWLEKNYTKEQV